MFDMHGMDGSEEQNVISFEELIASGHIVTSEGMGKFFLNFFSFWLIFLLKGKFI